MRLQIAFVDVSARSAFTPNIARAARAVVTLSALPPVTRFVRFVLIDALVTPFLRHTLLCVEVHVHVSGTHTLGVQDQIAHGIGVASLTGRLTPRIVAVHKAVFAATRPQVTALRLRCGYSSHAARSADIPGA